MPRYFHHNWWKERGTKINSSNIFEGCYWGKKLGNSQTQLTLDNMNIQIIELFIIKLSHKLPSQQKYLVSKTYKKSHLITRTIIALNKFVFHPNNCLVLLRIWVIDSHLQLLPFLFISWLRYLTRELAIYKNLIYFSWIASWMLRLLTQNNQLNFCTVEQKNLYFCNLKVTFK